MTRTIATAVTLTLAFLTWGGAAQARPDARGAVAADPGVTATAVTIGGSVPLSGVADLYGAVARGAAAYFDYVNANGGVRGRKIVYRYYDDAYNPAETVQRTRQLVQEDKVFAIFNTLGTEHNLAIRTFLNRAKIPHVFPASGATTFGRDHRAHPWTTAGFQPSYVAEGRIYGKAIGQMKRRARVAVLLQNDDYGKDVLRGIEQGLRFAGRGGRVVARQAYEVSEPDVSAAVARLRSSRADVLVIVATPRPAIQAFIAVNKLGWKPRILVNAVASAVNIMRIAEASSANRTQGAVTIGFIKDPTDPRWARDRGMRLYRTIFRRYGSADARQLNNGYNVYGMAAAYTFVEALKRAGRTPTRTGLMRALGSLNLPRNPFLLPGISVRTSRTDRFPLDQARLQRWNSGRWLSYGKLQSPKVGT